MVNRGASKGCVTCKQRRVKCDETKPLCRECPRVGRVCGGYGRNPIKVRFRDETCRYSEKKPTRSTHVSRGNQSQAPSRTARDRTPPTSRDVTILAADFTISKTPRPKQQDLALTFFLTYISKVGRSEESTRGFLEFLPPALATERQDSALSAAVNAAAAKLWAGLRPGEVPTSLPDQHLSQALVRLQKAVQNPEERDCDATVLATLVLQIQDTLSAVFQQQRASGTHRDGALALLQQRASNGVRSKYHGNLMANLFHSRISYCIRQKTPLQDSDMEWLEAHVIPVLPNNPGSALDCIGISVAKLQHAFGTSGDVSALVQTVSAQLEMWLEDVPDLWYPRVMHGGQDIDSSIDVYRGACEIYPSIQIANIWNQWRVYRLILEKIQLHLAPHPTVDTKSPSCSPDHRTQEVRELVDSLCRSIPFYMGNCTSLISFSDFENEERMFPSYQDLPPNDEMLRRFQASDHYASKVDHARHAMLKGPLHTTSILSNLIGVFAEERNSMMVMEEEQKHWIKKQFLRSLYLTRFLPSDPHDGYAMRNLEEPSKEPQAEAMAVSVKQALWTVNIL